MKIEDYQFELPDALIANEPAQTRAGSRLLCLQRDTGELSDRRFSDLIGMLQAGDLLVFNDTRVIPARLFGKKDSGGAVEVMLERVLDDHNVLAHIRASKSPKAGRRLLLEDRVEVEVTGRAGDLFCLKFLGAENVFDILDQFGRIPLPPYIEREATASDRERYQTVYAKVPGAVAAPTAGLHFDDQTMKDLAAKGVDSAFVTLHVGAGTFQPVRVESVEQHHMHSERIYLPAETVEKIRQTQSRGGRVIAVGTTVVRVLESVAATGDLREFNGETDIFIYPGFEFKVVDAMITNFHLPGSTLLLLVSAFAGKENIFRAYRHAIESEYRFYSYGDAMFIS